MNWKLEIATQIATHKIEMILSQITDCEILDIIILHIPQITINSMKVPEVFSFGLKITFFYEIVAYFFDFRFRPETGSGAFGLKFVIFNPDLVLKS